MNSQIKTEIITELFKPARKHFLRRRVILKNINDLFQIDLISIHQHAKKNNNHKFIFVLINCFSKFIWLRKLKNKSGIVVANALESVLKVTTPPNYIQCDLGKEFYNTHVNAVLKKYNIKLYSTYSDLKASIVERANRSILQLLYKLMSVRGNEKWTNLLQEVANIYNSRYHRSIKMSPSNVTIKNEKTVLKNLFPKIINKQKSPKFKINDFVRIAKKTEVFDKGFLINWSFEIFKVKNVYKTLPYVYDLIDLNNNEIKGKFYEFEMQKTRFPDTYLVQKVLKKKNNKIYVKYLGFDNTHNEWINKNDVMI
jgi:hypothetical protein